MTKYHPGAPIPRDDSAHLAPTVQTISEIYQAPGFVIVLGTQTYESWHLDLQICIEL